jgi:hypothetical protein
MTAAEILVAGRPSEQNGTLGIVTDPHPELFVGQSIAVTSTRDRAAVMIEVFAMPLGNGRTQSLSLV